MKSVRDRAPEAELVIVDTCSSDNTVEIAKKYADVFEVYKGPNGDWDTEMLAFDDAAAARQRSFELASGRWRGWIDADDVLPGPDEVARLLKINGRMNPLTPGRRAASDAPQSVTLEDLLRLVEKTDPAVDCICAPYLYRRDENDNALMWQERERIVLWDRKWHWVEPGHEILVPVDFKEPHKNAYFEHFLYVHEKKWTNEDTTYSIDRHHKIIYGKYLKGDRSTRTLRYLCIYAPAKNPDKWGQFTQDMLDNALNVMDHYRAHIMAGAYEATRGLYHQAIGHFGAAQTLMPNLPDAWFLGGKVAERADDWPRAAQWFAKAMESVPNFVDSDITPREFHLVLPSLTANALQKLAGLQQDSKQFQLANQHLRLALDLATRVRDNPMLGSDYDEGLSLYADARNAFEGEVIAEGFQAVFDYLRRNDETIKAMELLKLVPYTLRDDPRIIELEQKVAQLKVHLTSPKAYADFYDNLDTTTDAIPTDKFSKRWLTEEGALPRVKMLIQWLKAHPEVEKVVEYGSYDGIVAIPVLIACPNIKYTAIDANQIALDRMKNQYAKEAGVQDRLTTIFGMNPESVAAYTFDVAVMFEVIEHVPDPAKTIQALLRNLKPDGHLFVSTPWGSYDKGSPDEFKKPRDMRGHVRAMLMSDFLPVIKDANGDVVECYKQRMTHDVGNTLQAIVRKRTTAINGIARDTNPVNVFVSSALWDWNGRHVRQTGIGASEETIVYLGAEWAKTRAVNVFGPVPEEEVDAGVNYWKRPQIRNADPSTPLIVSRNPSGLRVLKSLFKFSPERAYLWLQDAAYPDLNAEIAAEYEKIVVLTEWHRMVMNVNHKVPLEKMTIINNFLVEEQFRLSGNNRPQRMPHHFIYASSPDRGLTTLLKMWPKILAQWPDATLAIFYGWDGCIKLAHLNPEWAKIYKDLRADYDSLKFQPGIIEMGRVNHQRLAWEMMRASAWTYPTDFAETGCCHGDTMISIPGDHRKQQPVRMKISELVGKAGIPIYVFDEKERRFRIGTTKWVKQTRVVKTLVELELDDGSKLRLTEDHPVMTFNEEWVNAGKIEVGQRLTALHHRYNVAIKDVDGRWQNESRLVGEWMEKRSLNGHNEHVDHLDPLRLDNRPESLRVLSAAEHFSKTHKGKKQSAVNARAITNGFKKWAKANPEKMSAKSSRAGRIAWDKIHNEWTQEQRETYFARRVATRKATLEAKQNHKVVAVRRIHGTFPVYNIEVEEENCHNYVADGVVIHNCLTSAKVMAAGCVPVCTPYAGLAETADSLWTQFVEMRDKEEDFNEYADRFVDGIAAALEISESERAKMTEFAIEKFKLATIKKLWDGIV